MKLKSKKWLFLIPIIGLLLLIPFVLTSCDDPATFFQKYGTGQNTGSDDTSGSDTADDDSGAAARPNIPASPY